MLNVFLLTILFFGFSFITLALCNRWLPRKLGCDIMGWHLEPGSKGFDGASMTGVCPRCSEKVLQDGQGNWF